MIALSPPHIAVQAPRASTPELWTAAQEALKQAAAAFPQAESAATQAAGLLSAYHQRNAADAWTPCEVGGRFHRPLLNPDTGRPSRAFTHAGAYAGVVQIDDRRWLLEHRTTSDDIESPAGPFWQSLAFDGQTAGYLLAHDRAGPPLSGVAYDVIRRPEIRPRLVPKGSARRSAEENLGTLIEIEQGTYCGWPLPSRTAEFVDANGRETLELFRLRLASDARERPNWYFQRRLVPRNDEQLCRQARELWQTAGAIRLARRYGQHYRNPAACWNFHSPCEFLAQCSGSHAPESPGADATPLLLPEALQVLTHSRIRCFQLCRRKHFYRYELGMRGADTQSAAGQFGRLMHVALAAWWQARLVATNQRPLPGT